MPTAHVRSRALGESILRLIAGLRGPDDIAPARLEATTGHRVEFNGDDARIYGFGERLDDRWICNVVSLRDPERGGTPNRLSFAFDDQSGRDDDWSAVRGLSFEEYADALTAAGYASEPLVGPRNAFYGLRFRRGPIAVDLDVRGESAERPDRLCVARILIDPVEARHAHA